MNKKRKVFINIVLIFSIIFNLIPYVAVSADVDMNPNNHPKVDIELVNPTGDQTVEVGEELEFTYRFTPQPIPASLLNTSSEKEIVLVLDTSGSMRNNNKMTNLKTAVRNFINKFKDIQDLKIGIVTYATNGTIQGNGFINSNDTTTLNRIINNMGANGGTNTGEGLRKAEYLLSTGSSDANKTIVFMSDGLPTYYCGTSPNFYTDINNTNPKVNGTGQEQTQNINISTEYAKKIGSIIKLGSHNIFSIGYGLGNSNSTGNIKMKEIHTSMGGSDNNFFATDTGAIDGIFNQIADAIKESYTANNINIDIEQNDKFDLIYSGDRYSFDEGKSIQIPDIIYSYNKESNMYETDSFEVSFKVIFKQEGNINFGEGIKISIPSIGAGKVETNFPQINITVQGETWPGKVEISVKDSSGEVNEKYESGENDLLREDKILSTRYSLLGKSYANFKVEAKEADTLRYQFVKVNENENITSMPANGWKEVSLNKQNIIENDIKKDKQGYLTTQYYDTSNVKQWSLSGDIFNNTSGNAIDVKADLSGKNDYLKKPGIAGSSYTPQSIFANSMTFNNIFIFITDKRREHKEAKKVWGYINPDKDISISSLQINYSNGGKFTIYIPNNNGNYEEVTLSGTSDGQSSKEKSVNLILKKDTVYPVYMEYYRSGYTNSNKKLAFNIKYKTSKDSSWQNFNQNLFYPSKSSSPLENITESNSSNNFKGQVEDELPDDIGSYYIAYQVGNKSENKFKSKKEGIYGPFYIDDRFNLERTVSTVLEPTNETQVVEYTNEEKEFYLNYKITPNNILVSDLYKNNDSNVLDKLNISNLSLIDYIPQYLEIKEIKAKNGDFSNNNNFTITQIDQDEDSNDGGNENSQYIALNINGEIEYTISEDKTYYTANPIIISMKVNVHEENIKQDEKIDSEDDRNVEYLLDLTFNKNKGLLKYNDVYINSLQGIQKESYFGVSEFILKKIYIDNSTIVKHGLIVDDKIQDNLEEGYNEILINPNTDYEFGVEINTTTKNSIFEIKIPESVNLNTEQIYLIQGNRKVAISDVVSKDGYYLITNINNKSLNMDANKTYVVSYKANFTDKSEMLLEAELNNGSQRDLFVESYSKEIPNITAELKSEEKLTIAKDQEVNMEYTIKPEEFVYPVNSIEQNLGGTEEVVFLLDTSNSMNQTRKDFTVNGINNKIINEMIKNSNKPIKAGFIQFNSTISLLNNNDINYDRLLGKGDSQYLDGLVSKINWTSNANRNLDLALNEADKMLQEKGEKNKSKAIVIITSGELSYTESSITSIKNKGYKIITVDLSYSNTVGNNNVSQVHCKLTGNNVATESNGYFIAQKDNQGLNLNFSDSDMGKVANYLKENNSITKIEPYKFNDAKLYFDLGDNFEPVIDSDEYKNLTYVSGNIYSLPIREIIYNATENADGTFTHRASEFDISFKIKVKPGKVGELEFGENTSNNIKNYLQYTKLNNKLSDKIAVNTPIITVKDELNIEANLIGNSPTYPYLGEDITVTYEIDPKEFVKEDTREISLEYANLIFNLGSDFTLVEGQEGMITDDNGNVILNLADKIKYTYDTSSNKYTSQKFNVSFKIKANRVGENITFISSKIKYNNILSPGEIERDVESPSITVRNNVTVPEYDGTDIRILEIEPADSFKLTDFNNRSTTGKEEVTRTIGEKTYKIEITHITMSEFIGKVDDLNGKYDVIVIGRYVDESLKNPNGTVNNVNDGLGTIWFRDYIDLENDITNKKATEIKEYINSGQLVLIDSDIKNMNGSKLWWHTTDSTGHFNQSIDNLIKTMSVNSNDSNNKITIDSVVNKYLDRINSNNKLIKPKVTSTISEGDSNDDILGKIYKRNMRFNVNGNNFGDENVTINLYLDINGDGLFKNEEIVKQVENVSIPESGYILDYNLYNDYPQFIGYLEWRIEIVKESVSGYSNAIKSYVDGNILFRRVTEEKRVINVLQVSPFDKWNLNSGENSSAQGKGGNLNLKTNTSFQNLLKEKEVQDYEINIEVISYQDFYAGDYQGPGHDNLNGSKYHMIIMGFADTFLESQLSTKAREQLRNFIESGQGLMLTHDTLWYKSWDGWQSNIRNTTAFIKEFRDIIGQSRYIDPNNESEIGLNNEKIEHDPNRPNSSYIKEAGATLLEINGVNNSNSTEVYRTNESLITNYPFKLEETIRVRRTHGQYLQLNFEEDDVVPLFNLTENNTNNPGNNEGIDWNHKNNKVNKYDSRNSYYTYSKGNITFSGTGENTRESVEYPDSELRLFINTIVKAERGANHKPDITALENITEVPYNSDLIFNAIVKDVDGDKIRVNKITVDGSPVQGYLTGTDYKEQGTAFPVTISANILGNKVNEEVKILIEAEDAKGAITVKEYKVKPIRNPLLTSSEKKVNSLIGESVEFQMRLNRENDTNPSSISIVNIELPETFGKINLKDVNTKEIDGEYYLVGTLTPLVELKGEEISIIITYSNGTSELKRNEAKIILNSKNANVNVIVKGNGANLGISPKITLLNSTTNKIYEKNISITDGKCIFDTLDSGKYEMSISDLVGYTVTSISINQESINTTNNIEFDIDYENSSKNIEIIVEPEVSDLTHGLYEGISSEKIVNENVNGFEIATGMNVNFGSTFILGGNSTDIKLTLDSYLDKFNDREEVNKNNIKVYKIVENNGEITLSEFLNESLEIKRVNCEYTIKIKDVIQSNTKILITYSAKIPDNSINKTYINNIDISGTSKAVKVYTRDTDGKPAYLPDLF